MQQNSLPSYEEIINRLNQDLDILEGHSASLNHVRDYTDTVRQSAGQLFNSIEALNQRFQLSHEQFNGVAQMTSANLHELVEQLSLQVAAFEKIQFDNHFTEINRRLEKIDVTLLQKLAVVETRINDLNSSVNLVKGEFNTTIRNFGDYFAKGIKDSEKRLRNAQEGMGEALYRELNTMNSKLILSNIWGVVSVILLLIFLIFLR